MIRNLHVQNFRRHTDYLLNFDEKNTIITGENGCGKTSLIEAIYIGLTGKSWRSNFDEILKRGEEWWRADIELEDEKRVVKYQNRQKTFQINAKESKILPRNLQKQVILFEPSHLNLIFGSPARRRDFFDKILSDIDVNYLRNLRRYERILKQRNILLKNNASRDELFIWDMQFADIAASIVADRHNLITKINQMLPVEYQKIAGTTDMVNVRYNYYTNDIVKNRQIILDELFKNFSIEINTGYTSVGPHQHDIICVFNTKPAATSVSRGENRTIILALKNIEYGLKKSHEPLILLDDIMSEFDSKHQVNLINSFNDSQVVITSVKSPKLPKNYREVQIP